VKNLYLPGIRLPVGGVVSILHRITGVLLVLALPLALYALEESLTSSEGFARVVTMFQTMPARVVLLLLAWTITHHLLAGLRHLLLDIDVGITRLGSRRGAWLVLAGVAVLMILVARSLFL
jgi:succinate dehydrogenase / fumarate reductase cytochrome b subunit